MRQTWSQRADWSGYIVEPEASPAMSISADDDTHSTE